jgi:hypothetical protein
MPCHPRYLSSVHSYGDSPSGRVPSVFPGACFNFIVSLSEFQIWHIPENPEKKRNAFCFVLDACPIAINILFSCIFILFFKYEQMFESESSGVVEY